MIFMINRLQTIGVLYKLWKGDTKDIYVCMNLEQTLYKQKLFNIDRNKKKKDILW